MDKNYYVYIMTNKYNTVLYTGVTSNLLKRVYQHKQGFGGKFSFKYRTSKLVFWEAHTNPLAAITREKSIKAGSRSKKLELIESMNPSWDDLYAEL